jgi:hypothetical protein
MEVKIMAYTVGTTVRLKDRRVGTISDVETIKTGKRGRPAVNYTVLVGGESQVLKSAALRPVKAEATVTTEATEAF